MLPHILKTKMSAPIARKIESNLRHFTSWVREPLKTGALLPSSGVLAKSMVAQIDLDAQGYVIELGPGTGVMTQAMLDRGISPEKIIVIERSPQMHALMSRRFPKLTVILGDACELQSILQARQITQVKAVLSSLPLLSMPAIIRMQIKAQMVKVLAPHGRIIQFTYGLLPPYDQEEASEWHLSGKRAAMVLRNVPPAHVWVYHK